ncbi:helix-turn-helix domain-containing protein [Aquimarina gracilis]|uniref:Helix-turn-helix domain-containing protein n=1 Tax=Aquimarina gracilis TaxID=874422 RepID=A0ABU6A029_9FLAO|nr:helix-turn-helix domain-containing protein [Aquimarina gracilis]MEB3347420.1 helix-turn-helix domain-containing protein [Aquimarina gracilis]
MENIEELPLEESGNFPKEDRVKLIVLESDAYNELLNDFIRLVKLAVRDAKIEAMKSFSDPAADWIDAEEAKKILGIKSKSKLQELRDYNEITFSQAGKKVIRYSKKSILEYLERNIVM